MFAAREPGEELQHRVGGHGRGERPSDLGANGLVLNHRALAGAWSGSEEGVRAYVLTFG